MKVINRLQAAVFVFLLLFCGCSTIPPANLIGVSSTPSKIVLHDSTGHLRTFDPTTEQWSSRISYPEMSYSGYYGPGLNLIRSLDDKVIVNVVESFRKNNIYEYSDNEGLQLKGEITRGILTAFDNDFYYITSFKVIKGNDNKVTYAPDNYRISISTRKLINLHFDEHPNIIVTDVVKKGNDFYYLGVEIENVDLKKERHEIAFGRAVILSVTQNKEVKIHDVAETHGIHFNILNPERLAQFVQTTDLSLIFSVPTPGGSTICSLQDNVKCNPAFANTRVCKPPDKININSNIYRDKNYEWAGGYTSRNFVGVMPYLVRFSAADCSSKAYELEPGFMEKVQTVFFNFLRYFHPVTYLGPG